MGVRKTSPAIKVESEYQFDRTGGSPSLDFVNSISHRFSPEQRNEHLHSYGALLSFLFQSQLMNSGEAGRLAQQAMRHEDDATRVLRRALRLREALFRTFRAFIKNQLTDAKDLEVINEQVTEAAKHRVLTPFSQKGRTQGGYLWRWSEDGEPELDRALWPIANAAAQLLASPELEKVRECEAGDCEWLFLDVSRNQSRRWCDMKSCGNREKARRHYSRMHG